MEIKATTLMDRIDGKGHGNCNSRIEFEEFAPWYQGVLDKHRASLGKAKVVAKPLQARMSGPPPPPCSKAEQDWLHTFRDGGAPDLREGPKSPVPSYHPKLPKPGDDAYATFREQVKAKFDHYDKGKKGSLDEKDIKALAVDLHGAFCPDSPFVSLEEAEGFAEKLMRRIDKKQGGRVLFEDFLPWYTRVLDHMHRWMDAHDGIDPKVKAIVVEKFEWYDEDKSGYLDAHELAMLVADLHNAFHPHAYPLSYQERNEMASILMHRVDCTHGNGNGRVEFEEFMPWYLSVLKDHAAFIEIRKEEAPPVKVKTPSKRQAVRRAAPPPANNASSQVPSRPYTPPGVPVLSESEASGARPSPAKLATFYQAVDFQLSAKILMLSWNTPLACQDQVKDIFDHGLPSPTGSASLKGGCGTSLIAALTLDKQDHIFPSLGRVLIKTAQELEDRCSGSLQVNSTFQLGAEEMQLPFKLQGTLNQGHARRTKALLIGINYETDANGRTQGSHKEVEAMRDLLIDGQGAGSRGSLVFVLFPSEVSSLAHE